jgi:hypothetical protein
VRKGRIFFLDLLVVFVISIILILSAIVLVKNWTYIVVENTIGRLADSLALDISENLINSPGCTDTLCSKLWEGKEDPVIIGLATLSDNQGVRNYVLDRNKVGWIGGMSYETKKRLFMNFVPEKLAGRDVSYHIRVKEIGGLEWTLFEQSAEPEYRTSVVRRLVMVEGEGELRNGLLEVMVIV